MDGDGDRFPSLRHCSRHYIQMYRVGTTAIDEKFGDGLSRAALREITFLGFGVKL